MSDPALVVGTATDLDAVAAAVADAGVDSRTVVVDATDPNLGRIESRTVAAVGRTGIRAVALADGDPDVVAVGADRLRHAVDPGGAAAAVVGLREGDVATARHPVVRVGVDGSPVDEAALEAALITDRPAKISEFTAAERSDGVADPLFRVRADGVVVATPIGSGDYAAAAGAPAIGPGTGVAVAAVSGFATQSEPWVVGGTVEVTVERDEAAVALAVDGRERRTLGGGETVAVTPSDAVSLVRPGSIDR